MSNLYLTNQAKLNWANAALGTLPTLAGAKAKLYKVSLEITPVTTLAALEAVQATFPGYSAKDLINWSAPIIVDGHAITIPDVVTWQATAFTPGLLYGVYVTNGAGDRLLGVSPFGAPVPVPFSSELQADLQIDFGSIFNL